MNAIIEGLGQLSSFVTGFVAIWLGLGVFGFVLMLLSRWGEYHRFLMNPFLRGLLWLDLWLKLPVFRRYLMVPYRLAAAEKWESKFRDAAEIAAKTQLDSLAAKEVVRALYEHRAVVVGGWVASGGTSYVESFFRAIIGKGLDLPDYMPLYLRADSRGGSPQAQLDSVLRREGNVWDSAARKLLRSRGPLLIVVDGLDELGAEDLLNWVNFTNQALASNLICLGSSRPLPAQSFHAIRVPGVDPETIERLIKQEGASPGSYLVAGLEPDVLDLLSSPQLLSRVRWHLRSGAKAPGSRAELLDVLWRQVTAEWDLEGLDKSNAALAYEDAFRSVLHGKTTFESVSLPHEALKSMTEVGLLCVKEGRHEYSHDLVRSFLAARHFVPAWSHWLEVEGRNLGGEFAAGMLDISVETLDRDTVEPMVNALAQSNPRLAGRLLAWLRRKPRKSANEKVAMGALEAQSLESVAAGKWLATSLKASPWPRWLGDRKPDAAAVDDLPRAGSGYPAIRVRKLRLRNIKCFEELTYDFTGRAPEADEGDLSDQPRDRGFEGIRPMTLMVGDNATGKSTILQAIALGCLGTSMANQTKGFRALNLLRRGATAGSIELELALKTDQSPSGVQTAYVGLGLREEEEDFRALEDDEMSLGVRNHALHVDALRRKVRYQWGLCLGYGAFRTLKQQQEDLGHSDEVKLAADRVLSLFVRSTTLLNLGALENLLYRGDATGFVPTAGPVAPNEREEILERVSQVIPGLEKRTVDGESRLVEEFRNVEDLSLLSDGANSMVAMLAHLTRHALQARDWKSSPFDAEGVVLIDEVDLHLHPTWQRRVLDQLSRLFPKMQIIATTHSPLVLGGVPDGNVDVLRQEADGSVELLRELPSLIGRDADQILKGSHFDVSATYDIDTEKLLAEYVRLANKPGADPDRLKELSTEVRKRRDLESDTAKLDSEVWELFLEFAKNELAKKPEEERADFAKAILRSFGSRDS